jgi:hypothetical protein
MSTRDRLYESLNRLDNFLGDREEEYDAARLMRLRSLLIRTLYWCDRRLSEMYFERRVGEERSKGRRGRRKK